MRSIGYIMGGVPRNIDDCIDHCTESTYRLSDIDVRLFVRERVCEECHTKELYATFIWYFSDSVAVVEERVGGIMLHENAARQKESINNANFRVNDRINYIKKRLGLDNLRIVRSSGCHVGVVFDDSLIKENAK